MEKNREATITAKSGGGLFGWVLPGIAAIVLVKTTGIFPTVAAFAAYYGFKERLGVALSLLISVVVAVAVFLATFVFFVHA